MVGGRYCGPLGNHCSSFILHNCSDKGINISGKRFVDIVKVNILSFNWKINKLRGEKEFKHKCDFRPAN